MATSSSFPKDLNEKKEESKEIFKKLKNEEFSKFMFLYLKVQ